MKKLLYILTILLIGFTFDLKAQPPDPGEDQDDPNCFPPPCVPIDGGLSWLLVAGVAYGGKKVYEVNKKEEDGE